MMPAILLTLCILSSGFTGNLYKRLSDRSGSAAVSFAMPGFWFVPLTLFFVVLALGSKESFRPESLLVAALAGISISVAASVLIESMKTNALSVSVIIINLNFVIPVLLSVLFLHEHVAPLQLLGMLLSIIVIVWINFSPGKGETGERGSVLLPLVACLANGAVNFCIKLNEQAGHSANWFFAVMYGTAALFSFLMSGVLCGVGRRTGKPTAKPFLKACLPTLGLMGVCNGVCFYMTRLLAERMNAAAQFTVVTCLSILLSLVIGFCFQGDKPTGKTWISILCCVLAVVCQCVSIA